MIKQSKFIKLQIKDAYINLGEAKSIEFLNSHDGLSRLMIVDNKTFVLNGKIGSDNEEHSIKKILDEMVL